jgi:hypothetical protein
MNDSDHNERGRRQTGGSESTDGEASKCTGTEHGRLQRIGGLLLRQSGLRE